MAMTMGRKTHALMKTGPPLVSALVGITTAINVAASKNNVTAFSSKTFIVLARIIGGQNAYTLLGGNAPGSLASQIPGVQGGGALVNIQAGIQPFGAINTTTFAGGVILLTNWVIKQVIGGKYGYHYISPFIDAIGIGTLGGGIIGGLLDPPAGGTSARSGGTGGFAFANATAGRSVMGFTGAI